ncbi:hypothetical protein PPACK8108_LOCUS2931 [Phakopsora pachyrhizi]|uniref:Uncharacterized protein n=1 Tax=Phakopsora pachyrhizi TaxID=170000 RepID=A0AAV0AMP0_PHAPC|nr:hypothetical protein PPACK8108_LOCUS2931 [Phakopsora pachyrhizi]
MTVVNLQSNLQNSSSSSLPVSLRLPLSPTTRSRLTPKSKSTNTTKPTAIRPHTPDLTNSRPKSPSQINLANLAENWGGGGPSELSYGLPDPPSPISAFEINLSTQSNDSQSSLNHSLSQDQRCPMYHQPKKVGDLTKERDGASAKAQKSGGSKTNEMVGIIKEQALKFEEERH